MYSNDRDEIKTTYVSAGRDSSITIVLALGLLAVFAGIVGAISGAALGYLFNSPHVLRFTAGGFAAGLAIAFVFAFRKLFYIIERVLKVDIDGDGYQGEPEPQNEYLRPIWVNNDNTNESAGGSKVAELPTPKDNTLEHMALILQREGREYFTQDNFTTGKKGTKLLNRDQWNEKFIPQMLNARLARYKNGENSRGGVELTDSGWNMFMRVAGEYSGSEYIEQLPQGAIYAKDTPPHSLGSVRKAENR